MNIVRTLTAGIIGGITVDLFLILARVAPFPGMYQWIASTIVGPAAYTSTAYIGLGLAMHFFISIAFALAYGALAARSRALVDNPTLGGVVFGIAVMLVMQVVTGLAHVAQPPSVVGIVISLIAHIVFFGLPVAWYIAFSGKRLTLAA